MLHNRVTCTLMSTWRLFRSPCHCKVQLKMYLMWVWFFILIYAVCVIHKEASSWLLIAVIENGTYNRELIAHVIASPLNYRFVLRLSLTHTHTLIHAPSSFTERSPLLPESFILKLLKGVVSRRIAQWTSQLVNMSNASVAAPKIIQGCSVMTVTSATPVSPTSKSPVSAGSSRCGEFCLICISVCWWEGWRCQSGGAEEVLASHAGKVWKFAERRELATPCWAKRMGAGKKRVGGVGENSMMV